MTEEVKYHNPNWALAMARDEIISDEALSQINEALEALKSPVRLKDYGDELGYDQSLIIAYTKTPPSVRTIEQAIRR